MDLANLFCKPKRNLYSLMCILIVAFSDPEMMVVMVPIPHIYPSLVKHLAPRTLSRAVSYTGNALFSSAIVTAFTGHIDIHGIFTAVSFWYEHRSYCILQLIPILNLSQLAIQLLLHFFAIFKSPFGNSAPSWTFIAKSNGPCCGSC